MTASELTATPLDAGFGARIDGVDLRQPLDATLVERLRALLFEHQVLFFRDQPLDDDQHLRFASYFGEPNVYPLNAMLGGTKPLETVWDGGDRKPTAAAWHTDVTWIQDPPKIGVLNAQVMPEHGGDTLWCSLYALHDALGDDEREALRDKVVHNTPGPGFIELVVKSLGEEIVEEFEERFGAGAQHPLLREHYVTGRPVLYLSGGFMDHVIGMEVDEGRALLARLMAAADDPAHHLRWDWAVDDVAIWDERSTMHRVDASHWPEPRRMRRCTVG